MSDVNEIPAQGDRQQLSLRRAGMLCLASVTLVCGSCGSNGPSTDTGNGRMEETLLSWTRSGVFVTLKSMAEPEICGIYRVDSPATRRAIRTGESICGVLMSTSGPHMSLDGRLLVHGGVGPPGRIVLALIDLETGAERILTDTCLPAGLSPAWSPDGNRIAFAASCESPDDQAYLHLVSGDGTGLRPVGIPEEAAFEDEPSWSPDSRRVALVQRHYVSPDAHPGPTIVVVDTLNGSRTAIAYGMFPTWSPAGDWIAYLPVDSLGMLTQTLALIRPDGTDNHVLYESHETVTFSRAGLVVRSGRPTAPLVWSPDGSLLAFHRDFASGLEIWVVSADGTLLQPLDEALP